MDHVNCGCSSSSRSAIIELANDVVMEKERERDRESTFSSSMGTKKKSYGNVAVLETWPTMMSLLMW